MKKLLIFALILMLCIPFLGCSKTVEDQAPPVNLEENNEETVANTVLELGSKLQNVSLLAPQDTVAKSMQAYYGDLVTPALLEKWQADPQNALGRMVSSPWPDRIEVKTVEKTAEDKYEVQGEIIEITSAEKTNGGFAAKRPITLLVQKTGECWLINAITLREYQASENGGSENRDSENGAVVYNNEEYGFSISLPPSWTGYSIVNEKWEGLAIEDAQEQAVIETGPLLAIRHPQWKKENQRQDIPILVFTLSQWDLLQQGKYHIGAAPIGPRELARNNIYVFALPARYNYAFPTGYEEVEEILESQAIKAYEITAAAK